MLHCELCYRPSSNACLVEGGVLCSVCLERLLDGATLEARDRDNRTVKVSLGEDRKLHFGVMGGGQTLPNVYHKRIADAVAQGGTRPAKADTGGGVTAKRGPGRPRKIAEVAAS